MSRRSTSLRLVAPFGHYGWGNIGDEATLQGFARLIQHSGTRATVSLASRNPAHTARVEPAFRYFNPGGMDPRRWFATLFASAHAIVGGTPIMDELGKWPLCDLSPLVRSVGRWNVPLTFIGIGTETLKSEDSRRIVAEEIAPCVRHWSVRCDRDRQRLTDYGVPAAAITVAADLAWLLEPATPEFGEGRLRRWGLDPLRPLIGVNLANENSIFDRQPDMLAALAVALDEVSERMDARVVFLCNEVREGPTFDKAAALKVIGRMKRADRTVLAPNEYFTPQQMMSLIACCDLTMSMRIHFCLFSALQGVPFIAIERSDKIADLCWDLQWPARVLPPRIDASEVVEHAERLAQDASALGEHLNQSIQRIKTRALDNLVALEALENGPPVEVARRIRIAAGSYLGKLFARG